MARLTARHRFLYIRAKDIEGHSTLRFHREREDNAPVSCYSHLGTLVPAISVLVLSSGDGLPPILVKIG